MIANIIEESYQNKNKPKRVININYEGPKEPFHNMEVEKLNNSAMNIKIKKTEKKINEDIEDLLVFSLIEEDEKCKNSYGKLSYYDSNINSCICSSNSQLKNNKCVCDFGYIDQ